jgi:hypothetical protein
MIIITSAADPLDSPTSCSICENWCTVIDDMANIPNATPRLMSQKDEVRSACRTVMSALCGECSEADSTEALS